MANMDDTARAEATKQAEQARVLAADQTKALQDELRAKPAKKKGTIALESKPSAISAVPAANAKAAAEAALAKVAGIRQQAEQSFQKSA